MQRESTSGPRFGSSDMALPDDELKTRCRCPERHEYCAKGVDYTAICISRGDFDFPNIYLRFKGLVTE